MRKLKRRWIALGLVVAALLVVPTALWVLLTYQPEFYRNVAIISPERRHAEARKFVAQSLQLRNDNVNEPIWEAVFTDEQVNSWLEEDLVEHFSDQIHQVTVPVAALRLRRALNRIAWSGSRRNAIVMYDRRVISKDYGSTILHTLPRCSQRQGGVSHMPEAVLDWLTSTVSWDDPT